MQALYESGMTLTEVGQRAGVNYQTVRNRLQRAGVPIRDYRNGDRSEQAAQLRSRSDYDDEQLRRMSAQGMTAAEIGAVLGKSDHAVQRAMRRRGIPRQQANARMRKNVFWEGGWTVDKHGYLQVKIPDHPESNRNGYVRHHRWVMEQILGRYLEPGEVVDHRNSDTSDNRDENLRLFASNGQHLSVTRTGMAKLTPWEREQLRQEAIQRAHQRVAAILSGSGIGAVRLP